MLQGSTSLTTKLTLGINYSIITASFRRLTTVGTAQSRLGRVGRHAQLGKLPREPVSDHKDPSGQLIKLS